MAAAARRVHPSTARVSTSSRRAGRRRGIRRRSRRSSGWTSTWPRIREWTEIAGTSGGWCLPGYSVAPQPEQDCGTRLTEQVVHFSNIAGTLSWTHRDAPWMRREKLGFDKCLMIWPDKVSEGEFPLVSKQLGSATLFDKRQKRIVVSGAKTVRPDDHRCAELRRRPRLHRHGHLEADARPQEVIGPREAAYPSPPRGHSSVGRAPALQAGGRRFEPGWLHWPLGTRFRYGSACSSCEATRPPVR